MDEVDVAIVGAGPAGLACAIEVAGHGASVWVLDENAAPGGQLFKQIHKFFGSRAHSAGVRGIHIGRGMLEEAIGLGVRLICGAEAIGVFPGHVLAYVKDGQSRTLRAKVLMLATGATENALAFPGSTLPGVMGAGAVQTMINVYRVLPGERFLMVGSGNVGLVVSYQIAQAGGEVASVVEAAPRIGGYAVHANKLMRLGIPILTSHTIVEAKGTRFVTAAVLARLVDGVPSEQERQELKVDTICLAVGLTPMVDLARLAGCSLEYVSALGGFVPVHNRLMETTVPGVYVGGDLTGVEEASCAMEEGRIAGVSILERLGGIDHEKAKERRAFLWQSLDELRGGPFGQSRLAAKARLIQAWQQPWEVSSP